MDYSLSGEDLMNNFDGSCMVIEYPELLDYQSFEEMFQTADVIFLLILTDDNYGHWVCLINNPNKIDFFDSHGFFPDDELEAVPDRIKAKYNQDFPHLITMLMQSPKRIDYSEYEFQRHGAGVNTCGRWCLVRASHGEKSCDEFATWVSLCCAYHDLDPDEFVTKMTDYIP